MVAALVAAGADLDAHAIGAWHHETPLHWAASNDDVELIDALLDAGADIEHPGSSIGGGPPAQSAQGYAQWAALRRLWQRGAAIGLSQAAALGLMNAVKPVVEATPPPRADDVSVAFWNACRAGQLAMALYLLEHGASLNWEAPGQARLLWTPHSAGTSTPPSPGYSPSERGPEPETAPTISVDLVITAETLAAGRCAPSA